MLSITCTGATKTISLRLNFLYDLSSFLDANKRDGQTDGERAVSFLNAAHSCSMAT